MKYNLPVKMYKKEIKKILDKSGEDWVNPLNKIKESLSNEFNLPDLSIVVINLDKDPIPKRIIFGAMVQNSLDFKKVHYLSVTNGLSTRKIRIINNKIVIVLEKALFINKSNTEFSDGEIVSFILHELGHIINYEKVVAKYSQIVKTKKDNSFMIPGILSELLIFSDDGLKQGIRSDKEIVSDSLASDCGLERELVTALIKLLSADDSDNAKKVIEANKDRLKNLEKLMSTQKHRKDISQKEKNQYSKILKDIRALR